MSEREKTIRALRAEHRAELKALRKAHAEHMLRVTKALNDAGAPTYGDCSEVLEMDERVAALKDQMTSPHASAALAAEKALVAYWKKKAETARAEALEEAQEAIGEPFRELDAAWPSPCERRSGFLDMHGAAQAALQALETKPAPATIPVERVREVGSDLLLTAEDVASVEPENPAGLIRSAVTEYARQLGVDLDAKGDACSCLSGAVDLDCVQHGSPTPERLESCGDLTCRNCDDCRERFSTNARGTR